MQLAIRVKYLSLIVCVLAAHGFVAAEDIVLKRGEDKAAFVVTQDETMNRTAPRLVVDCSFAKLETNVVRTEHGSFNTLNIPGFAGANEVGNPSLPRMAKLVEIPFGATPAVRVLAQTEQEYKLRDLGVENLLMPCQPSRRKDLESLPLEFNKAAYEKNEYSRQPVVTITEAGTLRNVRLFLLEVTPVAYNPAAGKIRVNNDISVEISLEGADFTLTSEMQQKYASPYFGWVSEKVMTPASLSATRQDITRYPVTYVIVADRMFAADLRPFIDWKTAKGFNVVVGYTDEIGKTKEQIQKYLHDMYKNATAEKPAPSFVLLVGDLAQVPSFAGTAGSYVTDLYYAAVTPDKIPDMYIGRFSAQNSAQLIPQINKTLEYEQYRLGDASFLKNVVLVAGWDSSHAVEWGWPQINYAANYYFNKASGYENIHKFLTSGSHQNEGQIVAAVSSGAVFVNYTAHGGPTDWSDPSFTKSNIDSLMNKGRYPLVVGNCCLTNKFDVDTCFGEAWLRADNKGAIGYIGGSSYTYWDEDLWWGNGNYPIAHPNTQGLAPKKEDTGDGAYDCGIAKDAYSNAAVMLSGNLAVEVSPSPRKVYYWEVYHLMGDPSLMVYWGVPSKLQVTHPAEAKVGTTLTVQTEAGAYIGVSANGELVGCGLVGTNGTANISLKAGHAGNATLVVTKKNRQPYTASIKLVD